ncbi:MAG: phenylalanine--tRNA ligase subunit beta, partial [Nitrospinota bacterium]
MLFSYLWLNEWIDHKLSPEELADGLTSLGIETGIVTDNRGKFGKIVVGHVESLEKHPEADKLVVCEVSTGEKSFSIICGAPNVAKGQKVALAIEGATLKNGIRVKAKRIRNVLSEGMICSEAELGISEDHEGIMVLDDECVPGQPLAKYVEVEDVILEVDLTPNRGDCLSLVGIAREVSAITGAKVKSPANPEPESGIKGFEVKMEIETGCPRYTACEISGVKVAPSPLKVRRRLDAVGIRPVSNIVDVTNYIMIETGHPMHAFDRRDLLQNTIIVRGAGKNEKLTTLDGRTHDLEAQDVVIADAEKGVALAGIMGGENSEIKNDTKDVILEAAYFDPRSVRRTSKRLGISSESSYRFERGVNPEGLRQASLRAA